MNKLPALSLILTLSMVMLLPYGSVAYAQNIPGSADAGRVETRPEDILPPRPAPPSLIPETAPPEESRPAGAEDMRLVLKDVTIEGLSVFTPEDIKDIYQDALGQDIALSRIWDFAAAITARYRQAGYFLSRAYVPAQEIESGTVILRVVEGYIGDVRVEGDKAFPDYLSRMLIADIAKKEPLQLATLERALLLLNDIPGNTYEAILERMGGDAPEGSVRLILKQGRRAGRGIVRLDNHGSRFTGPHRLSFAYEDSFLPQQKTAVSAIASVLPAGKELWTANLTHDIRLLPSMGLHLSLGRTESKPGYTLAVNDVESQSSSWGARFEWQAIRQRQQNLSVSLGLDGRNANTDLLGTPLSRDRIRALRLQASYDGGDPLRGHNILDLTLSRGLPIWGASEKDDLNLSRADAEPDFTKLEFLWQRSQFIAPDWLGVTTLSGQRASKALYSSEEFGFGGSSLGRAYDASEITGDHGIAGAIELQYTGLPSVHDFTITPFMFYEVGKIWNLDAGQADGLSAADAGIGFYFAHKTGINGGLTIAQPLSKSIDTPTYGNNGHNPRLYFHLGWAF